MAASGLSRQGSLYNKELILKLNGLHQCTYIQRPVFSDLYLIPFEKYSLYYAFNDDSANWFHCLTLSCRPSSLIGWELLSNQKLAVKWCGWTPTQLCHQGALTLYPLISVELRTSQKWFWSGLSSNIPFRSVIHRDSTHFGRKLKSPILYSGTAWMEAHEWKLFWMLKIADHDIMHILTSLNMLYM